MNLENKVIKVLNEKHGKKVIQWFESQGIKNPDNLKGNAVTHYYGDNGYGIYSWIRIPEGYTEITLPELPKRGDRIMVGDHGATNERIFITFIEGVLRPVVCVAGGEELEFEKNLEVGITCWRNYELIKPKVEVELTLEEIAAKFEIDISQLKIKK